MSHYPTSSKGDDVISWSDSNILSNFACKKMFGATLIFLFNSSVDATAITRKLWGRHKELKVENGKVEKEI